MSKVYSVVVAFILVYAILPNIYFRLFSHQVLKRAATKKKIVALTFDDGPDPRYTPELLNVLRKNNVKCTFFVLAENALKYPELIKSIKDDGHYIGLHSLRHINAIVESPKKTRNTFLKSISIMEKLGVKITLFRPPWGMVNLSTMFYTRTNHFKPILWSTHSYDWIGWNTVENIKSLLLKRIRPGDIVLLHDGRGKNNAPKRTIAALETVIPKLKKEGYEFVLVKDL
ncbi:polysaccharide deacetylase family protein [Clostridium cellulovorans]|uniref:Polysaccharide deacetylase n=2 Tax=Clostridium cellulovorans TaxID=1493 RepID=D9SM97_CLOC7|nr:polysaccharide deacetylase family protein [Clostridium cellulovorans]ADL53753.1 polysaccharide deacetylase [Clostridium cellulovorans 743B]